MADGAASAPTSETAAAAAWRLTGSAVPRLVAGALLLLAGLLLGRVDVAVLGVPLLLGVVLGLSAAPTAAPVVALTPARLGGERHDRREVDLSVDPSPGTGTVALRVSAPEHRTLELVVDVHTSRELRLHVASVRTGRQRLFRVDHLARDADAVLRAGPTHVGPVTLLVLPRPQLLSDLPLPHRLQGATGAHRSTRAGDGGEFRDLAVFAPGDRLRRIDWKATARRGQGPRIERPEHPDRAGAAPAVVGFGIDELYVRRAFATSEAHVMLLLDVRDALGPDVATWDTGRLHPDDPSSLDHARTAATSLARRWLAQGDRVGVAELGTTHRLLPPAGGRRQLRKIAHHVAQAEPLWGTDVATDLPRLPTGALVVVLSTFLDDAPLDLARTSRFAGHRTVAVDVLPAPVVDRLTAHGWLAHRMVAMEREDRLVALAAAGVEVVTWDAATGDLPPEAALAMLARTRRAGR